MLSFIGRRKILRLYKARATNKTVINPSRDAIFCVSQATIPQTDAKLYTTYKHAIIPRETQNLASHKRICRKRMVNNMPIIMIFLASHKQPCRKPTLNYISHISMLLSLGRRKILRLYLG